MMYTIPGTSQEEVRTVGQIVYTLTVYNPRGSQTGQCAERAQSNSAVELTRNVTCAPGGAEPVWTREGEKEQSSEAKETSGLRRNLEQLVQSSWHAMLGVWVGAVE